MGLSTLSALALSNSLTAPESATSPSAPKLAGPSQDEKLQKATEQFESMLVLTISFHRVETSMDSNCSVAFCSFSSCDGPASLGALGLVALSGAVSEFDRASAESVRVPWFF